MIRPRNGIILVRPEKKEKVLESGLVLPDTAADNAPVRGEVVAVGPGVFVNGVRVPLKVSPGAKILYHKQAGSFLPGDEVLLFLEESDILAIIQE